MFSVLPLPDVEVVAACTDQVEDILVRQEDSLARQEDTAWYEQARHLLTSPYLRYIQQRKYQKMNKYQERDTLANIRLYGSEEKFLNTQIYPNVPATSARPRCTGITRLTNSLPPSTQQVAFVGFYGSGNHLLM